MSHITIPASPAMHWLSAADIYERGYLRWMIRDIFPETGYGVIAGEEGSGKTQILMDIAAHVATFDSLWGHTIERNRPVIYVMLEGQAGLLNRLTAWEKYYSMPYPIGTDRVTFIDAGFSFYGEAAASVLELQDAMPLDGSLIIVDTLRTASTGFSENSTDDMAIVADIVRKLCIATKSFLLFAHHVDKKNGLVRGSTVITNNSDVVLKITSDDNGLYTISSGRIKEAAGRSAITTFKHHPVVIGTYDDGDPITAVVPEYQDHPPSNERRPTGMDLQIYLVLENFPDGATLHTWKTAFCDQYITANPSCHERTPRVIFDRGKKHLINDGFVLISDRIFTINHATSATTADNTLLQISGNCEFVEFGDTECTDTAATIATSSNVAIEHECNNSNVANVADTNVVDSCQTTDAQQCAATATPPVSPKGDIYGDVLLLHAAASAADAAALEGGTTVASGDDPCYDPRNSNSGCSGPAVAVAQNDYLEGEEGLTTTATDDTTATPAPTTDVTAAATAQQDEPRHVKPLPPSRQPSPAHHDATPTDRSNRADGAPADGGTVAEIPAAVTAQLSPLMHIFHAKIKKFQRTTPEQPPQQDEPRPRQGSLIPPSHLPTGYQEGAA